VTGPLPSAGCWPAKHHVDVFGIPANVVRDAGAFGLLLLTIVGILTGRLIPRKVLDDVRADRDARLAERDKVIAAERERGDQWRAATQAQDARNDLQTQQITQLVDTMRTMNALLDGMRQAWQDRRR